MGYADCAFYKGTYHGDVLAESDADKWLDRASDELDHITYNRLIDGFPSEEKYAVKVRKAVCAIADALSLIDRHRQAAAAQQTADGSYHGAIASISSGKESISYAALGTNASVYASAAADDSKQAQLIISIACKYLANIPDASGTNLLYAGW